MRGAEGPAAAGPPGEGRGASREASKPGRGGGGQGQHGGGSGGGGGRPHRRRRWRPRPGGKPGGGPPQQHQRPPQGAARMGGLGRDNRRGGPPPEPSGHTYDVAAERELMRSLRDALGQEIAEASGGDRHKAALLAAITANESGGSRQAYRFEPESLEKLRGLLAGDVAQVDGLKKEALEKRLGTAESDGARQEMLKKLAGLHGYTLIPGYYSIQAKTTLEGLTDRNKHFQIAAKRLDYFCKEYELDPAVNAASLGRCWNTGHPNGRTRSALYSWRLQERIRLYLELESEPAVAEPEPEAQPGPAM